MSDEPQRRSTDQPSSPFNVQPTPEVLAVLLRQVTESLDKLDKSVHDGFRRLEDRFDQAESRISALERFRERVEERERAQARDEGRLQLRWPAVAALLTGLSLIFGIIVAVLQSTG